MAPPSPASGTGIAPPRRARTPALAVASLVLGLLGLVTSVILVGSVLAAVGFVLGVLHLRRSREARMMGWTGVWLSVLAMVATAGFLALFFFSAQRSMQVHVTSRIDAPREVDPVAWSGQSLPDFEWITLDGDTIRSSDWRGRRVVLTVGATWCAPCVQEVPHLNRLQTELGTNRVVVVGLSGEDRVVLKAFARKHGVTYPLVSAGPDQLPGPLGQVEGFPTTVILDAEGKIETIVSGPMDFETLKARVTGSPDPAAAPSPSP